MLAHAEAGRLELILCDLVEVELVRVLATKAGWRPARVEAYARRLRDLARERPRAPGRAEAVSGDPDDDRILACAIESRADVLVSGNRRHLLPLGERAGVRLLTAQALLLELRRLD